MKLKLNIAECRDSDQPNDVTAKIFIPCIVLNGMGSESIAHDAGGRMDY